MRTTRALAISALLFTGCGSSASLEDEGVFDVEGDVVSNGAKADSDSPRFMVPLVNDEGIALASFNDQLPAGAKTFPDYVEVGEDAASQKTFAGWADYALELPDVGEPIIYSTPDFYTGKKGSKTLKLCYQGDPTKLGGLAENLTDNVFSDQFILWGWRYKNKKHVSDRMDDTSYMPSAWKHWKGTGEGVLLVYSIDDSGELPGDFIVPKCVVTGGGGAGDTSALDTFNALSDSQKMKRLYQGYPACDETSSCKLKDEFAAEVVMLKDVLSGDVLTTVLATYYEQKSHMDGAYPETIAIKRGDVVFAVAVSGGHEEPGYWMTEVFDTLGRHIGEISYAQ